MYKVSGEMCRCGITDSGRVTSREGYIRIQTKFCKLCFLNGLSKFDQICSVGFLKFLPLTQSKKKKNWLNKATIL